MSLSQLWKTSPEQIEAKLLHQVIAFAGDGKLRDDQETSIELRAFLSEVSSEHLRRYAEECLEKTARKIFTESGFALQDIVNEVGRRLGLHVRNGRYRGTKKHVGYDGLWSFPNGHNAVVEVTAVQDSPGLRVRTLENRGKMALFGRNSRKSGARSQYLGIPAVQGVDVPHAAWGLAGVQRPLEAAETF